MAVDVIGMIFPQDVSEIRPGAGPLFDKAFLTRIAVAHEAAGFDRVLVGYFNGRPETTLVTAHAAAVTQTLEFMVAHRAGFVAPALAARAFATLDHLSGGRVALHAISGASDADQQQEGDFLGHDARYERTAEYLGLLKRLWTSETPFDHDGAHYRLRNAFSALKPAQAPHPAIYFGGASPAAISVAAQHADVFAIYGEPLADVAQAMTKVRAEAVLHGRAERLRFNVSLRLILGDTEAAAWERARSIYAATEAAIQSGAYGKVAAAPANVGSQRLLAAAHAVAGNDDVADDRLWMGVARITGAQRNSSALVGTPDQVVDALLAYYDLGVTSFLIRGFEPVADAKRYGTEVIPRLRAAVAARKPLIAKLTRANA